MRKLPEAKDDEAIAELVRHLLSSRVVDGLYIADTYPEIVGIVFMPIAFGALADYSRAQLDKIAIFGVIGKHKAAGAYDGWPIFWECEIWRRTDWRKAVKLYERAKAALDDVLAAPEPS